MVVIGVMIVSMVVVRVVHGTIVYVHSCVVMATITHMLLLVERENSYNLLSNHSFIMYKYHAALRGWAVLGQLRELIQKLMR